MIQSAMNDELRRFVDLIDGAGSRTIGTQTRNP